MPFEQFGQHRVEGGDQAVDLGLRRSRADQHHVVEGRDQHAPVQKAGMHHRLDLGHMRGGGLRSVAQGPRRADEFDARAHPHHMPRRTMPRDGAGKPGFQPCGTAFHPGIVHFGHHLAQRRAQAGELQRVGRQRRAHP